jgi:hypothetical protein
MAGLELRDRPDKISAADATLTATVVPSIFVKRRGASCTAKNPYAAAFAHHSETVRPVRGTNNALSSRMKNGPILATWAAQYSRHLKIGPS